ncbi:hypothetical protein D3C85_1367970 [compost metagenome]
MPWWNVRRRLQPCPKTGSHRRCRNPGRHRHSWKHHAARVDDRFPGPVPQRDPDSWRRTGYRQTTAGHRRCRPRDRVPNDLAGSRREFPTPARRWRCSAPRLYRSTGRPAPGDWSRSAHWCHAGSVRPECCHTTSAGCRWPHPGRSGDRPGFEPPPRHRCSQAAPALRWSHERATFLRR